jgi:hypothetical protein
MDKYLFDLEAASVFEFPKLILLTSLITSIWGLRWLLRLWWRISTDVYWIYWRDLLRIVERVMIRIIRLIVRIMMLNVRILILRIRIISLVLLIISVGRLILIALSRIRWIVITHIIWLLLIWIGLVALGSISDRLRICDRVLLQGIWRSLIYWGSTLRGLNLIIRYLLLILYRWWLYILSRSYCLCRQGS